jgi:2-polyprenyl-6-methoxyphenol hydroxylase-like FAD-dependent oxidoreductase
MIGQSYVEKILAKRLERSANPVRRSNEVRSVEVTDDGCLTHLANGESIRSKYVIAADGSRSKIREEFRIPFQITRPQIIWAVVDGVLETDFPKVPEIIVFQSTTSDVAWIPRERNIDRFYVRMDTKSFTFDDVLSKINRAVSPHRISFETIEWQSQFSVKESVAESFSVQNRIFFAGDACHIHSVNGGQGLNTGLADAFNLIWKLSMVEKHGASKSLLGTYESERKPVAISVIETSGELVRSTKHSDSGTHAQDYVKIVQKRAGNITGMGVRYGDHGIVGTRLYDISIRRKSTNFRLYSLLDYSKYTLLVFGQQETDSLARYPNMNVIRILTTRHDTDLWTEDKRYLNASILVRPDAYIEAITTDENSQLCET